MPPMRNDIGLSRDTFLATFLVFFVIKQLKVPVEAMSCNNSKHFVEEQIKLSIPGAPGWLRQ